MSLILSLSPDNISIKTYGYFSKNGKDDTVFIDAQSNKLEINIEDFFAMVYYVLTNTDLYKNDPRLKFIEKVKKMKKVEGYNKIDKHLL